MTCLIRYTKSSDFEIRKVEHTKFRKDNNSRTLIQTNSMKRYIPRAMDHFGPRDGHFNVILKEFATLIIAKSAGY